MKRTKKVLEAAMAGQVNEGEDGGDEDGEEGGEEDEPGTKKARSEASASES